MHQQHACGWDGERGDADSRFAGRGPFGGGRHHHDDFSAFADWNGLRGGGRRGGGRMFGHGDLKLLLLALIEQQPRHGYELIRTIEDMFHAQYSPSPGTVYPTLTMLEEMGHVAAESEEGGRKRYAITDEGRSFLNENRDAVEAVMESTERKARFAAKLATPMAIRDAVHALKHALAMRVSKWDKAEAERVVAILERAAREIAAGGKRD
ncbi:MAG TPA: PadR family transcriptional regulator [Rhodanobacteraceae bacterium]|nr:PadR family transcriptional regulator [Rhodanobacteraceae bacterium]